MELHCWSLYGSLLNPWIEGVIEALAKVLHHLPAVEIRLIKGTVDGSSDHEVGRKAWHGMMKPEPGPQQQLS